MTPTVEETRVLAYELHTAAGQDYGGQPYIVHPDAVAKLMHPYGTDAIRAALLHDTVEDTKYTLARMAEDGFSPLVVETVDAVSKRPGETYFEFVRRASQHPLGRRLKLADNTANSAGLDELARTEPDRAAFLRTRYGRARLILTRAITAELDQLSCFSTVYPNERGIRVTDADEDMQWIALGHHPDDLATEAFNILAAHKDCEPVTADPIRGWAINTGTTEDWELQTLTLSPDLNRLRPITADDIGAHPITYIPA